MERHEHNPIIVEVNPDDAEAILDIRYRTWLATYTNEELGITTEDIETLNTDLATKIEKAKKTIIEGNINQYLAKENGKAIAWLAVEKSATKNNINALYVLPEYQGKGIGAELMKTALEVLDADRPILLSVASYNDKAIAFYERHGFTIIGEYNREKPFKLNGKFIPELLMEHGAKKTTE